MRPWALFSLSFCHLSPLPHHQRPEIEQPCSNLRITQHAPILKFYLGLQKLKGAAEQAWPRAMSLMWVAFSLLQRRLTPMLSRFWIPNFLPSNYPSQNPMKLMKATFVAISPRLEVRRYPAIFRCKSFPGTIILLCWPYYVYRTAKAITQPPYVQSTSLQHLWITAKKKHTRKIFLKPRRSHLT